MNDKFFPELARRLKREGIFTGSVEKERLPVLLDGQEVMSVAPGGTIFLQAETADSQPVMDAYDVVARVTAQVHEYTEAMMSAPPLKAMGLHDGFRLLADFNGIVLAGQELERGWGYQFVTWTRSPDRSAVAHGHYYDGGDAYEAAKLDFACRAGLVDEYRQFTDEQLAEVYRCVSETLDSEYPITGTIIVTETKTIDGYTIDEATRTQSVKVNAQDTQYLTFYNDPIGGLELIKVSEADKTVRIPDTTFEIRRASDGGLVKTVTTGKNGRVYVDLDAGSYYALEIEAAKGYKLDSTQHPFTVQNGRICTLTVTNAPFSGIIIHKVDSITGAGIYEVKFLVYDQNKKPIGEYSTDITCSLRPMWMPCGGSAAKRSGWRS